jgi:hypothetical protein
MEPGTSPADVDAARDELKALAGWLKLPRVAIKPTFGRRLKPG